MLTFICGGHCEMFSIPCDSPPGELARLARVVLIERTFDAPVMRQVQLTPARIIKICACIRDSFAQVSCGSVCLRRARIQNELVSCGRDPIFDLPVNQLSFCASRITFLKSPIGVERNALA